MATEVPRISIDAARRCLRTGDIGLLPPTGGLSRWIYRLARSDVTHACMFAWLGRLGGSFRPCIIEQTQPEARIVWDVAAYLAAIAPGQCRVFRPRSGLYYDGEAAADWMLEHIVGVPYPRRAIWRSALSHLALTRWKVRPDGDDEANGDSGDLYCSGAVARACRLGGGVDLVPRLADTWTEPGDLAKSAALEEVFWLVS